MHGYFSSNTIIKPFLQSIIEEMWNSFFNCVTWIILLLFWRVLERVVQLISTHLQLTGCWWQQI